MLSLKNNIFTFENIQNTPTRKDGVDFKIENDLRVIGCELIQISGMLLRLPQTAMASGQIIFQRFYYTHSFVDYDVEITAMACIYLASKLEEVPRYARDVINVFEHMQQRRKGKFLIPLILDEIYMKRRVLLFKTEHQILNTLGFRVLVKQPHKLLLVYIKILNFQIFGNRFMCYCWNYMNDALRTHVFKCYQVESIACACIYLSARKLAIILPNDPVWYGIFTVPLKDIIDICYAIMELYTREKPNLKKLHAMLKNIRIKKNGNDFIKEKVQTM